MRDMVSSDQTVEVGFPGQAFTWKGDEWWVQELGRSLSGQHEDSGTFLTLLGFRLMTATEGEYSLEALVPGAGLAAMEVEEVVQAAEAAVPFKTVPDEPKPFFGPRGGGRGGRSGPRSQGRPRKRGGR